MAAPDRDSSLRIIHGQIGFYIDLMLYNPGVVEMNQGCHPLTRKRARARVRRVCWLLLAGLLLLGAGPACAYLGLNYSGRLALAQQVSAADVTRGIDFGPVYLEQGVPGRYFLSAVMPQCPAGYWQTRFQVLDANKAAVFSEDEIRFIDEFMFQPGQLDRYCKDFTLSKNTGYYYFRYGSINGAYPPVAGDPPVLAFAVRQRVLAGYVLWGPVAGLMLLGLLSVLLAIRQIKVLAAEIAQLEAAELELQRAQDAQRAKQPTLAGPDADRPKYLPRIRPWMPGWRPTTQGE